MTDPAHNLEQFGLQPGMHVADIGAGSGYYTIEAAKLVGGEGKVFALDIQKELLEKIKRIAREESLRNIEVVWGNAELDVGTRLRDASVDAALVTNTLFQIEDKPGFAREVARIVKSGGKLLVVDWSGSFNGMGPAQEYIISRDEAVELFELAGFTHQFDISAGDHHYGFTMTKETTQ